MASRGGPGPILDELGNVSNEQENLGGEAYGRGSGERGDGSIRRMTPRGGRRVDTPRGGAGSTRQVTDSDDVHALFQVSEDAEQNLLSVEGDGVAIISERRGEVLLDGVKRFFNFVCCFFPCCIVLGDLFNQLRQGNRVGPQLGRRDSSSSGSSVTAKDSGALSRRAWPDGFGPGWAIRTFCPLILLLWCRILYNGCENGPGLFKHLQGSITAPDGSPSALAEAQYKEQFLQVASEDFPAQTVIMIERIDGSSVLTREVEIFSRTLQEAVFCPVQHSPEGNELDRKCSNDYDLLKGVYKYSGYFMHRDERARHSARPIFVNGDESATMIYVQQSIKHSIGNAYFDFLDDFLARNAPNPSLYRVTFSNEQKLLNIAQVEVIYDFEHADLVGIPFAWVILLWYCGFPAFLVVISLPVCILYSFSMSVYWMPHNLSLPTFAPSMIVSMAVALNVDYALFMLVRYYEEIMRGATRNYALDKAMSTAGKTIAVSGTIMLMSNGCLYFVQAETVASLGVALAVTNFITILTNITLLPALLFAFGGLFQWIRARKVPSLWSTIKYCLGMLLSPFSKCFDRCFGSGRRRKGIKVLQHTVDDDCDDTESTSSDGGLESFAQSGEQQQQQQQQDGEQRALAQGLHGGPSHEENAGSRRPGLRHKEKSKRNRRKRGASISEFGDHHEHQELLIEEDAFSTPSLTPKLGMSPLSGVEAFPMGGLGAIDRSASDSSASAQFLAGDYDLASTAAQNADLLAIDMNNQQSLLPLQQGNLQRSEWDESHLNEQQLERLRQRREAKIRQNSQILSAQSRIWASIAKLCLNYPKTVCIVIVAACIPLCVQVRRFKYTDSQANLVPMHNSYVDNVDRIGSVGLNQGFLADYKGILAAPPGASAHYHLTKDHCFDDDLALRMVAPLLQRALDSKGVPVKVPLDVTCASLADAAKKRGLLQQLCAPIRKLGKLASVIPNHCAYTCDSCRPELLTSKEFFEQTRKVSDLLLDVSMQFATVNATASGGYARTQAPVLQSLAYFQGRYYDWEQARSLVMKSAAGALAGGDTTDKMYAASFHNMTGWNGTHVLFRVRPPFQPYNQNAHPFSNRVRHALQEAGFDDTEDTSHYRFYWGGSVVRLFDQVDAVYDQTPPIMMCAVVLTVLLMSILVFQSLMLGPRLLLTVALTVGLTFGVMVIAFQDLGASPDSAGLYWIVPILGIPIMVGCTLDYDSFVVARIFEMRLASLSTEAAVFAGLQETGHVITIAGVIMTVAFGSMMLSAIPVVQQIGALLVVCCLLDTFIIRSLLVPALMLIATDYNWYPKQMPPVQITMNMLKEAAARSAARSKSSKKPLPVPVQTGEEDQIVEGGEQTATDDTAYSASSQALNTSSGSWASFDEK